MDGLAEIVKQAAGLTMDLTDGVQLDAVLHLGKEQAQNFENDEATASGGADNTVRVLFWDEDQKQDAETSRAASIMVRPENAPDGIDETDRVTVRGKDWNVYDVRTLPAEAGFILKLRR